jgi:transcriptional regulator with XRE-family HTH domain
MHVRRQRLARAWSQEQLAEASGLSVRTIQRVERGQPPSLETRKAPAAVFDLVKWMMPGWGLGVIAHGVTAYELVDPFGAAWEKREIERRLGRPMD